MNLNIKSRIAIFVSMVILLVNPTSIFAQNENNKERRILVSEYRDKMMAGWIGTNGWSRLGSSD